MRIALLPILIHFDTSRHKLCISVLHVFLQAFNVVLQLSDLGLLRLELALELLCRHLPRLVHLSILLLFKHE